MMPMLILSMASKGATLQAEAIICATAQMFEQIQLHAIKGEVEGVRYMLETGCAITDREYQASLLEYNFLDFGVVKIRVFAGGKVVDVYTAQEWFHY
jgi:hypothetical protein